MKTTFHKIIDLLVKEQVEYNLIKHKVCDDIKELAIVRGFTGGPGTDLKALVLKNNKSKKYFLCTINAD